MENTTKVLPRTRDRVTGAKPRIRNPALNNGSGAKADVAAGCDPGLYREACKGNQAAYDFLCMWHEYCHEIDDIIDELRYDPEYVLTVFAHASQVYSHPFYVQFSKELRLIVLLTTNAYMDSIAWHRADKAWQRRWASVLNFAGLEMVYAIASICGGYAHMRGLSLKLREMSWTTHFDEEGNEK